MRQLLVPALLASLAAAQKVGDLEPEVHPKLSWKRCSSDPSSCETVPGEVTLDSEFRWLHAAGDYKSCFSWGDWELSTCNTTESCTDICAVEGAQYDIVYGVTAPAEGTLSQQFVMRFEFSSNANSRVLLLEDGGERYATFTLLNNELAFDVDLSTVECGLNAAINFVAMEPDGGMERFPTNEAGARYGTGYCDASCPRYPRFVAGKANIEGWRPDEYDPVRGTGYMGACCPEFDVWNSNSHSYQMSSKMCQRINKYEPCEGDQCNYERLPICDPNSCDFNPYRLGVTDFYGKSKVVDTTKKFAVVTRWEEDKISQFFIQDGKKIEAPDPAFPDIPGGGIDDEYCTNKAVVFQERDFFAEMGSAHRQNEILSRPMVMALSIQNDYYAWNLWLDGVYPPDMGDVPGSPRGHCSMEDSDPQYVERAWPTAKVIWSNIRFGPVGSTVDV